MSLVVRPKLAFEHAYRLVALSAHATARTLANHNVEAYIKWPNDILIKPKDATQIEKLGVYRKLGGILLEMLGSQSSLEAAVIGIGLNLRTPKESERDQVIPQMGFVDLDVEVFADAMLASLAQELQAASEEEKYLAVLSQIRTKSAFLGQRVSVDSGARVVSGVFEDLLPDGGFLLRTPDGDSPIYVGDVSLDGS